MAITSFPWASVGGDRPVSDAMDAAYYAAVHGNIVLHGLQPTVSGTNVSVSAGTAVVQGRVVHVDAPVTLTPTVNTRARVVLRLDLTNRTASVALSGTTTSYPSLTRTGSTWEMGLGTADTTGALAVTDTRTNFDLCGIYDTGWLKTGIVNYRKVGKTVYCDWYRSTSIAAGAGVTIGTLPVGYRPANSTACAIKGDSNKVHHGVISIDGAISVTNTASTAGTHYGSATFVI